MHEDESVSDIGRVSDEKSSDVSVLSDMIEIRNGFKTCDIFSCDDVNDVMTEIIVS